MDVLAVAVDAIDDASLRSRGDTADIPRRSSLLSIRSSIVARSGNAGGRRCAGRLTSATMRGLVNPGEGFGFEGDKLAASIGKSFGISGNAGGMRLDC